MTRRLQTPTPIDPVAEYVFLGRNGASSVLEGGAAFWSQPPEQLAKLGHGWLVSESSCTEDWPDWELHPEADEVVYLLEGDVELLLEETPAEVRRLRVQGRGLVVVPRGAWHKLRVHAPSRLLHVTMGAGTRHRPVGAAPNEDAFELAQFNLGIVKGPLDSAVMADFAANLARVNAEADASPGFVWRLVGDAADDAARRYLGGGHVVANLSVWRDLESLRRYVYESGHLDVLRRRREWFERLGEAHQVLWWVPRGHRPDAWDALARLDRLRREGAGPRAFTFRDAHPPPEPGDPAAVALVPLAAGHAGFAHELWSDAALVRYTNWEPTASPGEAAERIARLQARYGGEPRRDGPQVAVDGAGVPVGLVGIDWVDGEHEVWYLVRRARWRQGYGTAMLAAALERAAVRGYPHVVATAVAANEASWRLLERAGFRRVATLVQGFRRHGVVADLHRYERNLGALASVTGRSPAGDGTRRGERS